MSELDPSSQALLEYIQERRGYVDIFRMINTVERKTGLRRKKPFYFRRLAALVFEGRIEATVYRSRSLIIRFRRLRENGLEELPNIEEDES